MQYGAMIPGFLAVLQEDDKQDKYIERYINLNRIVEIIEIDAGEEESYSTENYEIIYLDACGDVQQLECVDIDFVTNS